MTAPYDHPLNLQMQTIFTIASWAITLVFLIIAIRRDRKEKTLFNTLVILAGMVAAFAEPIYDVGMMLWFYAPGMWMTYDPFDIPQPVWTHSGYVILYSAPAMYIAGYIRNGLGAAGLYKWAAITFVMSATFEICAINGGLYTYWGPHTFRILNYPLVIAVLETAQVICFAVAAAELRRRTDSIWPQFGLFPLFLCTFYLSNFGAGAPLIISLHLDQPTPLVVGIGSIISIIFAAMLIRGAAGLLPDNKASNLPQPNHRHAVA